MTQCHLGNFSYRKIRNIIEINHFKRVFLVTNKNSFLTGGISQFIFQGLIGCKTMRFHDFNINPKFEDAVRGVEAARKFNPDLIIGVGGGSAMDMSKLIHYLSGHKSVRKELIINGANDLELKTQLMLIPTTSGSGSEATHFAVVYIDGKKQSLAHSSLLADYTIVDGLLTKKLPPNITAYTGVDALCQAIESYWANDANEKSKFYAIKALKYLVPSICDVVTQPSQDLREKMAIGSFYAGKAINITKTTAPHAFSYHLTTRYGVPHGQAVGIILPYFILPNSAAADITPLLQVFKVQTPLELKTRFVGIMKNIRLYRLVLNILNEDIENFINAVSLERLANNPATFSKKELVSLFS